jgi:hypothetical protein
MDGGWHVLDRRKGESAHVGKRLAETKHDWVAAAHIDLDPKQAKQADFRGSIRIPEKMKIEILDVYCRSCKRPFEDVFDEVCSAVDSTEHLRGGPIGERIKRKHPEHDCERWNCDLPKQGWEQVLIDRVNAQRARNGLGAAVPLPLVLAAMPLVDAYLAVR